MEAARKVKIKNLLVMEQNTALDFQKFFEPLQLCVQGLVPTAENHSVNHSWKFIRRADWKPSWGLVQDSFHGVEENGKDCIFTCKQFMSNEDFSQTPQLALPASSLTQLGSTINVEKVNALSDREVAEYTRTASKVSAHPWNLKRAEKYILALVQRSKVDHNLLLPPFDFFEVLNSLRCDQCTPYVAEDADLPPDDPPTPRRIAFRSAQRRAAGLAERGPAEGQAVRQVVMKRPAACPVPDPKRFCSKCRYRGCPKCRGFRLR